ncbi:MAG TPA: adenylate/guanylate cyclase domain-containing protein [Chitinophagaceae bacterium]|nr:adenylate/guanylate cyclase domain-containing protein [Chitinophagaceae bacterium]
MRPIRPISTGFSVIKRYKLRMILIVAVSWTAIDSLFYIFRLTEQPLPSKYSLFQKHSTQTILLREANVFFLSMVMAYFLIFFMKNFFRKSSLWLNMFLKAVILIVAALIINFFIHFSYATLIAKQTASYAVMSFYRNTFETPWLIQKIPEWIILFVLTQLIIEINEKYSPGVFVDIVLGKYVQPKDEKRIIMFIDLKDSTTIAEKLGHKEYFKFIRDFIYYISTGIMEYGGRIYQYVGDEIVVSWPDSKRNAKKCIYALIEARKSVHKNLNNFVNNYGVTPEFKAGIHVGEVTIGEIGIIKKDLVMSGDTMNTTARIRTACNELNQKFIISKDFLDQIQLKNWQAESLGPIELKGKNTSLELFALRI